VDASWNRLFHHTGFRYGASMAFQSIALLVVSGAVLMHILREVVAGRGGN
jgi:hypothetical protein